MPPVRTTKGRVVYERKPHLFTYADVLRIVRKVEVREDVKSIENAWETARAALDDMVSGLQAVQGQPSIEILTILNKSTAGLLANFAQISSFIPGFTIQRMQEILDRIIEEITYIE